MLDNMPIIHFSAEIDCYVYVNDRFACSLSYGDRHNYQLPNGMPVTISIHGFLGDELLAASYGLDIPDTDNQVKLDINPSILQHTGVRFIYNESNGGVSIDRVFFPFLYSVTLISYPWRLNLSGRILPVKSVSIPQYGYFRSSIVSISIKSIDVKIGESAFAGCNSLKHVYIHSSSVSLATRAFADCSGLESFDCPDGVSIIEYGLFQGCTSLTEFHFSNSVHTIKPSSFFGCEKIRSIFIPASVHSISPTAFADCTAIDSIIVDKNNPTYDSRENCNMIIDSFLNKVIIGCKASVIPNTVSIIGECAFANCGSLVNIQLPNSIVRIESCAFHNCSNLISIAIPDSVSEIAEGVFDGCHALSSVRLPQSISKISDRMFAYCKSLTTVEIPNSISYIGKNAFRCCYFLRHIIIPLSVKAIGTDAFKYCNRLSGHIDFSGRAFEEIRALYTNN